MHSIYAQVCVFHETKERGSEFCEKQTNEQTDVTRTLHVIICLCILRFLHSAVLLIKL